MLRSAGQRFMSSQHGDSIAILYHPYRPVLFLLIFFKSAPSAKSADAEVLSDTKRDLKPDEKEFDCG